MLTGAVWSLESKKYYIITRRSWLMNSLNVFFFLFHWIFDATLFYGLKRVFFVFYISTNFKIKNLIKKTILKFSKFQNDEKFEPRISFCHWESKNITSDNRLNCFPISILWKFISQLQTGRIDNVKKL